MKDDTTLTKVCNVFTFYKVINLKWTLLQISSAVNTNSIEALQIMQSSTQLNIYNICIGLNILQQIHCKNIEFLSFINIFNDYSHQFSID